ncbi:MAG: hypothetical protein KJ023_00115 [Burkholderiaceae bacterium]|nr:hypothetical protein [Burkholderiaceae bacterium]
MSRWGSVFRIAATAVYSYFSGNWAQLAVQIESERQRRKRDKANARARAAYNEAQKDRLEMLDLLPDAPRSLVLGRVRYVEGVRRRWTSGTHSEKLTMIVSLAGHEIDAIEGWYIDDVPVTRDGSGYVQQAPWRATQNVPAQNTGTADGSGGAVITLSYTPVASSWSAQWSNGQSGEYFLGGDCSVSVTGTTATVSGASPGSAVTVNYLRSASTDYVRILQYLGESTQNIGDILDALYPGKISATDRFAGIAAFAVEMAYSPDVFPQGPPNITAVMRGAKCYDPRLDSTVAGGSGGHRIATPSTWAWTENPALHALRYALWGSGFNLAWGRGITAQTLADVIAAANACDVSTVFTLRMPDTSTDTVTLPRYRCGITISADADPRQAMDAIVDTMAGEWAFDGPELRLRAGVKAASVASIDQTWLVEAYDPGDDEPGDPILTSAQSISREQRWNHVSGKCVDPSERYQMLPYPAVRDTTLISAKGEKRGDLDLPGVNHVAHAQHLASMEIRRRQAGTLHVLQCDPRAELLQLFDVVTETLPDYGISAKPFEVVGVEISFGDAPARLMLREIADDLFTVDAELTGRDPAPDSSLRAPWDVGTLGTLTVTSGTAGLQDNSIVARALVTWPAVTGEWIRNGGKVEIQYTRADQALPAGDWASWVEEGNSTSATIPGLLTGRPYLFRGRLVQALPLVRGPWSAVVAHQVVAATAAGTIGGGNLLRNSSCEVDSDANGLADDWTGYSNGTTGAVTYSVQTGGVAGGKCQRITAANLGTAAVDQAGITQTVDLGGHAGKAFTFSPYVKGTGGGVGGVDLRLYIDFYSAAGGTGSIVGVASKVIAAADTAYLDFARYTLADRVPQNALSAKVYVWMTTRGGAAGTSTIDVDAAQFEIGAVPTAYAPRADELLAGVVTTGNLAANAATFVNQDTHDFAGTGFGTFTARTWTITPAANCTIEFSANIGASNVLPDSGNQVAWYVSVGGGSDTYLGKCNTDSLARQVFPLSTSFSATGGVSLAFKIKVTKSGGASPTLYESSMRATEVYR